MKRSWSWSTIATGASALFCGWSLLAASAASAHINMLSPLVANNNAGDEKATPCDGARGSEVFTFEPGAFITLGVSEEVKHDSYFRIAFDDDGQDFAEPETIDPINPNRVSEGGSGTASKDNPKCLDDAKDKCGKADFCRAPNKGAVVLYDNIDPHLNKDSLGKYTWTIQLPNVECANCTLQVLQVMEDIAFGFHGPFDGSADIYHRCLPIQLKKGAGAAGPGNAAGPAKVGATSQVCGETAPVHSEAGAGGSAGAAAGSGGASSAGSSAAAGSAGTAVVAPAAGSGGALVAGTSGGAGKVAGSAGATATAGGSSPAGSAGGPSPNPSPSPSASAGNAAPTVAAPAAADSGCSVRTVQGSQPVSVAVFALGVIGLGFARRRVAAASRRKRAS
ncbi:MAG: hypothetical protein RL701_6444 [Pseudomonadota bacterium]